MEMYGAVLPPEKAKVFVDQIFLKFDSDKSDTIDFKVKTISDLCQPTASCLFQEFMLATNMSETGNSEEKLRLMGSIFDIFYSKF